MTILQAQLAHLCSSPADVHTHRAIDAPRMSTRREKPSLPSCSSSSLALPMDQAAAPMAMAMGMAREPPAEELLVFSAEDTAPRPNSCTMPASAGGGGEERRPGPSAAAPERVPAEADTGEPREGTVERLAPTPQSFCKPKVNPPSIFHLPSLNFSVETIQCEIPKPICSFYSIQRETTIDVISTGCD